MPLFGVLDAYQVVSMRSQIHMQNAIIREIMNSLKYIKGNYNLLKALFVVVYSIGHVYFKPQIDFLPEVDFLPSKMINGPRGLWSSSVSFRST